jgi:putative DNA primase/helicase
MPQSGSAQYAMDLRDAKPRASSGGAMPAKSRLTARGGCQSRGRPVLTATLDAVIQRLREHRCEPKQNGEWYWAFCPSHDHKKERMDLHVREIDGHTSLTCHSGCEQDTILYDIGLNFVVPRGRPAGNASDAIRRALGPAAAARIEASPKQTAPTIDANGHIDYATFTDSDLGIIRARTVQESPIDWLWKYRFARGEMALLAGDGGLGKSSLLLSIASLITTGGEWPDGAGHAALGDVVIVSAEDSRETTLKPRLIALKANLDRIVFVTAKKAIRKEGQPAVVNPVSLQDLDYWREILKRVPGCKMLIIDPLPSYLGRGVNDAKNSDLRAVVEPFIDEVTRPAGVCFVANTHLNKNGDAKTPLHRITGSMAYGALPRNVHIVVRDRDRPERRLFVQGKCNIAPDDLPAVVYTLVKATIPSPNGEIETAYPVFDAETVKVDLQEAMGGGGHKRGPEPIKTTEIARFLVEFMKGKGPVFLGEIMEVAGARNLIGTPTTDRGRPSWTYKRGLYRAIDEVPSLAAPDDGWKVVTSKDDPALLSLNGKARWELRLANSPY